MTRRPIINLFAFAVIAAGGYTLLDVYPVSAATYSEWCDKMAKLIKMNSESCTARGGTYSSSSSCDGSGYSILDHCEIN